jgi:signal transduction histidine kinase
MQPEAIKRGHIWNNLPLHVKGLMLLMVPVPALMLAAVVLSGTVKQERQALAAVDQVAVGRRHLQEISALLLVPGAPAQDYHVLSGIAKDLGPATSDPDRRREIESAIQQKLESLAALSATSSTDESLLNTDQQTTRSLQAYISALALEYDQTLSAELNRAKMVRANLFAQCFKGIFILLLGELLAAIVFIGAVAGQIRMLQANSRRLAEGQALEPLFTDNWELNRIGRNLVEASVAMHRQEREIEAGRGGAEDTVSTGQRLGDQQRESMVVQLRERNQELARALSASRRAVSTKGHFLSDLSRELRIPLASILGFSELLYDEKLGPVTEQQKGCLSDILAGSKRLLQLADSVTGAAHADTTPASATSHAVDLDKLVKEVKYSLVPAARKKGVRVEVDIDPGLREVGADPGRLKQLLHQHIANAIEFTPHDATLNVRMRPEGPNALRIEVQSTGLGIPSKDVLRLFPEFHVDGSAAAETAPHTPAGDESAAFYAILPGVARRPDPAVRTRNAATGAPKGASALIH